MAATPPPNTPQTPPGWYADPGGSSQQRWWDGNQWTDHLQGASPAFSTTGTAVATDSSRGIATLAHLSALIAIVIGFVFVGPLVVYLAKKDDPYVRAHAAEALNFNLSWMLWSFAFGLIAIVGIVVTLGVGVLVIIPLAIAAGIAWLVLVIVAAMKANNGEMYRYPLTIRFVS
jgi:uncharacterized Tic20 family protein